MRLKLYILFFLFSAGSFVLAQEPTQQVLTKADKMPQFVGGQEALTKHIEKTMKYPKYLKENNIQGIVNISFVVNSKGNIENISIGKISATKNGENISNENEAYELAEEAVRIVKLMPAWIPGKQKGVPVNVQCELPIKFTL